MEHAEKIARYEEIYRRGLEDKLPPEKRQIADELVARGVIKTGKKPSGITVGDVTRSGLQGVSLGFSDEIAAGISAPLYKAGEMAGILPKSGAPVFMDDKDQESLYTQMQKARSQQQKQFAQEHPVVSGTAEVAGALVPALMTGGSSLGTQTLAQTAKTGAKIGAVQGGIYGAGTADPGERAEGAVKGTLIGGVLGAVLPPVLVGGGRLTRNAVNNIANVFGGGDKRRAIQIIRNVADDAGISAEDAADQLQKLGPEATLADVSENFLANAKAAVNQLGPQKQAMRDMVRERQLGEHADVLKVLSKQLGNVSGDDVFTAVKQNGLARSQQASPLYEKAFQSEIPKEVLNNPKIKNNSIIQRALKSGEKYAEADPDRIVNIASQDGADAVTKPLTPMERWHYAKQAIWAKEAKLRRAGDKEMANNMAKQRMIIDEVLNSNEDYAKARKIWSSSIEADEASNIGRDFFNYSPYEFKEAIKGLNKHDLDMVKMGLMNAAEEKAGDTKSVSSIAGMLTDKPGNQKKIELLFGGKDELNELIKNADKWGKFRRTKNVFTEGSITTESRTTADELASLESMTSLEGIKKKALEFVVGKKRLSPGVAKELGSILTRKGLKPEEVIAIIGKQKNITGSGIISRSAPSLPLVGERTISDYMRPTNGRK